MVVTFLIGNGFDRNFGLNTLYTDFYSYYCGLESTKDDFLATEIKADYPKWSDLEMGLADFAASLKDSEISSFLNSKEKMEDALVTYLKGQEARLKFSSESVVADSFKAKTINFYKELNMEWRLEYESLSRNLKEPIVYQFVNFNYTNTLSRLIELCKSRFSPFSSHTTAHTTYADEIKMPLHIHGTLNGDLILGINSMNQLGDSSNSKNPELATYLVKSNLNKALGERRIDDFCNIINRSRYLLLYGLSWGDSDQTWWEYIMKWLLTSPQNRLILCRYIEGGKPVSATKKCGLLMMRAISFQLKGDATRPLCRK